MTDPAPASAHHAHVVVHHVVDANPPYRRVDILGETVGKAHSLRDVTEFCRHAGLGELDVQPGSMVEWIGGGPEVWE